MVHDKKVCVVDLQPKKCLSHLAIAITERPRALDIAARFRRELNLKPQLLNYCTIVHCIMVLIRFYPNLASFELYTCCNVAYSSLLLFIVINYKFVSPL